MEKTQEQNDIPNRAPVMENKKRVENKRASRQRKHNGLLVVFEGLDGAGKSTQVERLKKHLKDAGYSVVVTSWNSSKYISRATKRAKRAQLLTPNAFSALHATDFFYRLENIIAPSLAAGKIVIADRYAYTAVARGRARGIDTDWVNNVYSLAIEPDIAFLCDVPVDIALERVTKKNGNPPKYYEAGMDVSGEADPIDSFKDFQTSVAQEYAGLVEKGKLIPVEMDRTEDEIFDDILNAIEPLLDSPLSGTETFPPQVQEDSQSAWFAQKVKIDSKAGAFISRLPEHNLPGKLIVIEGAHRAGVTHQVNVLYDWLQVRGVDVVKSGFGSTWITTEITNRAARDNALSPRTNILLTASEISYILEVEVLPALERGATVILNRYLLTTFIEGLLRGIDRDWLMETLAGLGIRPDLTIYLDVPFETLQSRVDLSSVWGGDSQHAGLDIGFTRDVETSFEFYQRRALDLYRDFAESNGIPTLDSSRPPEENYAPIANFTADTIGFDPAEIKVDKELQEVLELYHAHNGYFEHAQKVREFAVRIYDASADIHGLGSRPRRLLEYAALLHDVGHSEGARHEERSYRIIMDHNFSHLSNREKRLIALISLYHNGPAQELNEERQANLRAEEQLAVRRLAGILRLADALDASNKQVVTRIRVVREAGAMILDINAVGTAKAERKSVLAKRDLFERYFNLPVLVDRNRAERIIRRGKNTSIDLFS
ncbi:dTMP kinase [bacterium]|nr:MAG: dTMP kinase [bacterium]